MYLKSLLDMVDNIQRCPDRHCLRCNQDIQTIYKCIRHLDVNGEIKSEQEKEDNSFKMQSYAEFEASLTPEERAKAKAEYDQIMAPFAGQEPLLCGPEGRAATEGPEALTAYYKEGETYMRKVAICDFDE